MTILEDETESSGKKSEFWLHILHEKGIGFTDSETYPPKTIEPPDYGLKSEVMSQITTENPKQKL